MRSAGTTMCDKSTLAGCVIAFCLMAASLDSMGQASADVQNIRQELDALRATQAGMQKELQEIKALLRQPVAPLPPAAAGPSAGTEISLDGALVRGAARAPVVLVEFSDFQCPFCASFAATSYSQICIPRHSENTWPPSAPPTKGGSGRCMIGCSPIREPATPRPLRTTLLRSGSTPRSLFPASKATATPLRFAAQ
jgi:hypothetical protein